MRYADLLLESGFDLFREQMASEYNRLTRQIATNRQHVIARSRQIIRQIDQWTTTPNLTDEEELWLEVMRESFAELLQRAGGTL
jgi:hypothetical protein